MAQNKLPTEEELLSRGTVVSDFGGLPPAAPTQAIQPTATTASGLPTEAELLARGQVVSAAGPAAVAPPSLTPGQRLQREAGLALRAPVQAAGSYLDIVGAPLAVGLNRLFPNEGGQPRFQTPSQNLSYLLNAAGVPQPASGAERISGTMQQRAYETIGPAALAKNIVNQGTRLVGSQPVQNVLRQIGANPMATTVASTAGAGAGQGLRELGVSEPVATAADIATGALFTPFTQRISNAAMGNLTEQGRRAEALAAKAKAEGVNLSAGDLGSRAAQRVEEFTQDIMLSGREAMMQKTGEQIKAALTRLDKDVDLGTSTGKALIGTLRNQYNTAKGIASSNYNKVSTLLDQVPGTNRVPTPKFAEEAKAFLKEFPKYLDREDVPTSTKNVLSALASGNVKNVVFNYDSAREVAKAIGQALAQAERQSNLTGSEAMARNLKMLYGSLQDDFGAWATSISKTNPAAVRAYADADAYFKQTVLPFRSNSTVYKAVSSGTGDTELATLSDTIMQKLLRQDQPELAKLTTRLGGQRAAEAEVVQRATRAALDDRLAAEVSPARFVNTVNMQDPMTQAVLSQNPQLMQRVQNLSDIAQAGRGSVQAMGPTPRTGIQAKNLATAAGLLNPATALPTAGLLGASNLANRLSMTPAGQNFVFAQGAQPGQYILPTVTGLLPNTGQ